MRLVDEQDDRRQTGFHLIDHRAQSAFKFALDAGTSLQETKVKRTQRDVLQDVRHLALHNAQRKSFDDRSFPYTGFASQNRIVLSAAQQDIDHLAHLGVTPQYRINLAVARLLDQIHGVFVERWRT